MAMTDAARLLQQEWIEEANRERVGAEMARAAVAEFLGMERSLREAARHLAAAEEIGCVDGEFSADVAEVAEVAAMAAMAARVTLAGQRGARPASCG